MKFFCLVSAWSNVIVCNLEYAFQHHFVDGFTFVARIIYRIFFGKALEECVGFGKRVF